MPSITHLHLSGHRGISDIFQLVAYITILN